LLKHSKNISSWRRAIRQLTPTSAEHAKALLDTFERSNAACNAISQRSHEAGATRKCDLKNLLCFDTRRDAQAVIRRNANLDLAFSMRVALAKTNQSLYFQGDFRDRRTLPQRDCNLEIGRRSASGFKPERRERSRLHGPLLNVAGR
jgi:hypothetical protein